MSCVFLFFLSDSLVFSFCCVFSLFWFEMNRNMASILLKISLACAVCVCMLKKKSGGYTRFVFCLSLAAFTAFTWPIEFTERKGDGDESWIAVKERVNEEYLFFGFIYEARRSTIFRFCSTFKHNVSISTYSFNENRYSLRIRWKNKFLNCFTKWWSTLNVIMIIGHMRRPWNIYYINVLVLS